MVGEVCPRHTARRFHVAAFALTVTFAVVGVGCGGGNPSVPVPGSQDDCGEPVGFVANLPLYDNYYDFVAHACVRRSDALLDQDSTRQDRLSDYSALGYLSTTGDGLVRADLRFTVPQSPTATASILSDLPSGKVDTVGVTVILGKTTSYTALGLSTPASYSDLVQGLPDVAKASYQARVHPGGYDPQYPDLIYGAMNAGSFVVEGLDVQASPRDLARFWERHHDAIARISPE